VTKMPFDNPKVRRALSMAIDRKSLVDNVFKGGQTPAFAFTPGGIPDYETGKSFREVGGDYFKEDIAMAKQLMAEAGYPEGKNFPEISILYNTNGSHQIVAQAIQDMWSKNLGIKLKLVGQEAQVYLDSLKNLQYDVARTGFAGDYVDPMTFLDLFVTKGGNNLTGWSNADYDKAITTAKKSGDQKVRMQSMHDAEQILMTDMPVIPIYYDVHNYVIKDYIKGVTLSPLGFIDFKNATVQK
jgi:ABC-type oligopeptide transport system, periplasmic component